jgi:hypothetical protein
MTEELCSTLLFHAPTFPKAEGVFNTYQKFVQHQEGRGGRDGKRQNKKSYKLVRLVSLWASIPTCNLPDNEIQVLTIKLMHTFVRRVKINSHTQELKRQSVGTYDGEVIYYYVRDEIFVKKTI